MTDLLYNKCQTDFLENQIQKIGNAIANNARNREVTFLQQKHVHLTYAHFMAMRAKSSAGEAMSRPTTFKSLTMRR